MYSSFNLSLSYSCLLFSSLLLPPSFNFSLYPFYSLSFSFGPLSLLLSLSTFHLVLLLIHSLSASLSLFHYFSLLCVSPILLCHQFPAWSHCTTLYNPVQLSGSFYVHDLIEANHKMRKRKRYTKTVGVQVCSRESKENRSAIHRVSNSFSDHYSIAHILSEKYVPRHALLLLYDV